METVKKTRTRRSPEARASEILDHAARIVSTEGVAGVSMEKIGKAAEISKSLVYSYFPSTTELLKELYAREMKSLRSLQAEAAKNANSLEQLVRQVTHVYLNYIEENGLLIYRLQSEPSLANVDGPSYYDKDGAVRYLAEILCKLFDIPMSLALPTIDISFGLPDAAGRYLDENHADRQTVEDITVAMILGSIMAVKDSYDVKFKPIK